MTSLDEHHLGKGRGEGFCLKHDRCRGTACQAYSALRVRPWCSLYNRSFVYTTGGRPPYGFPRHSTNAARAALGVVGQGGTAVELLEKRDHPTVSFSAVCRFGKFGCPRSSCEACIVQVFRRMTEHIRE